MAIMLKCVFQNTAAELNVFLTDKTLITFIFKMLSNGAFSTRSVFKLENLTALDFFLSIVFTVSSYWTIVLLLCLTCVRDFCEIFIFTIFKIVERVIWILEITGFEQINNKNSRLVSNRGVQTDLSLHNVTEEPVSTIKFRDYFIEKESQTSPFSQSSVCSQDFISIQHRHCTSPQPSSREKSDLNAVEEGDKLLESIITVNDIKAPPINSRHNSLSPVSTIHLTPCSAIKCKDATVSFAEKETQTSPLSSVYSQDFTSLQHQDFTPSQHQDFTPSQHQDFTPSQHQNFTSSQQNNSGKYDLNVVKEVEKLAEAIITVNDLQPSHINSQHMSPSPVCTIHLTPCSTNRRTKYSKVLVDNMSPEEFSYLRRKWNSLKKSKKRPYLNMQSVFPNNTDDSTDGRTPKKARLMIIDDCDNKEPEQQVDSPEMNGCYKNLFLKLKSKFSQRNNTLVSYKYL